MPAARHPRRIAVVAFGGMTPFHLSVPCLVFGTDTGAAPPFAALRRRADAAIEVVASEAGFGTALSLRQHFRAHVQTSPSSYRRQLRAGQDGP